MATSNSVVKNQGTNIIVVTGNDETFENLLSIIQKSGNSDQLTNISRHTITRTIEDTTQASHKRRKTDLTCVICEDKCSGYNFNVISCGSCKSFFHRNASQNLDDLKCLSNTNKCDVKFNNRRHICRRCRLKKCRSVGMKWNSSTDEKLNKKRQLEENRRSTKNTITTLTQTSFTDISLEEDEQIRNGLTTVLEPQDESTNEQLQTTQLPSIQQTILSFLNPFLTSDDNNRLNSVKLAYETAFRVTKGKRDMSALNHITDRRSALLYITSIIYDIGMKLITFIRRIPEFELLNKHVRFMLVKYNSPMVYTMRECLNYDRNKGLVMDPEADTEEYAIVCRELSYYCYGEQFASQCRQMFHSIKTITDDDPLVLQLMTVTLIFAKSISIEEIIPNEQSTLMDSKQVYEAQSIYTSLLFRYLIQKYSCYYQAARRYSQLIQRTLQMQVSVRASQQLLQEHLLDASDEEINPALKSVLRLP